MDKITTISFEEELITFWQKGWPEYALNPYDDHPAIRKLIKKISDYLKLDPQTDESHQRCCTALVNIASYCRLNMPWAGKNIYFFNMAFQTLYNEMSAKSRIARLRSVDNNYHYKK